MSAPEETGVELPEGTVSMTIVLTPDGNCQVSGSINSMAAVHALLGCALEAVQLHHKNVRAEQERLKAEVIVAASSAQLRRLDGGTPRNGK